ncbi:TetR/AcrR family transcriptional regulator [Streptomyces sp. NPDC018019]|uniref:TetR/AcrR family transcriptional regulator n=1 Tax=Streptomyces sp. NPDC018019 TaxID=3365030 RepID=UPI0037A9CC27
MPKIVDPAARRRAVADAVLRVIGREGVEGASLRNVAEEAGLAIGSVRHYFRDHDELLLFTMRELSTRIDHRVRAHVDRLLDPAARDERPVRVEELIGEFLALDEGRRQEAVLWLAFCGAARTRPELRACAVEMEAGLRDLLARVLREAQESGALPAGLDVDLECLRLSALLDGLNLRAMLEPEYVTPEAQRTVLRRHLQGLRATPR